MCGIVAAARLNTKASKIEAEVQEEIMRFWHTELMMLTEERGKDAAGSALLWEDGSLLGIKHGTSVSNLICDWDPDDPKKSYLAFMKVWRKYNASPVSIAIGHCRKLSIGTAWKNENNHPHYIKKKLVLIHNGTLKNHHKLKNMLSIDCKGDTDSEVIANLVYRVNHEMPKKKDKGIFTVDQAEWVVDRLQGSFACIALNADNPYQMMAFRDGRPFELALSKKAGLIFVASETKFFSSVLARYERARRYYGMDHWPDLELTKQAMPDDHAWVINLKDPVDNNTKIADLIESKSMPKEITRLQEYKVNDTTVYASGYHGSAASNKPATTTTPAKKDDDNAETRKIDGKERQVSPTHKSGYIWHPEERIYVKQDFSDLEDGKVASVDRTKADKPEEETVNARIKIDDMSTTVDAEKTKESATVQSVPAEEIVDEKKHPKTLDDAVEEYVKLHGHFQNQKDAAKAMDVFLGSTNKDTARVTVKSGNVTSNLDLKVVADRVRKTVCEEAFSKGWESCEVAAGVTAPTIRRTIDNLTSQIAKENNKKKAAEEKLLGLKSFVLFLVSMIDAIKDDSGVTDDHITNALALTESMNHTVRDSLVHSMFTERESAMAGLSSILDDLAFARSEKVESTEGEVAVAAEEE